MSEVGPVATTPFGLVRGLHRDRVSAFKGIRYATADRFAAPVPCPAWGAVLDAVADGPRCPQLVGMLERTLGLRTNDAPMSEDCLFLNIWTPAADDGRRPVLVWIHGGAFQGGTGSNPWWDGAALARRLDCVVVTVNYRLGLFGFGGGRNNGLLDQVAALQWVRSAIAAFGGDPQDVTLAGQSAGAASVLALMTVPAAAGSFRRAFAMSPSVGQIRTAERAHRANLDLLALAAVHDIDALRDRRVEELLELQERFFANPDDRYSGLTPHQDGTLVGDPFLTEVAASPIPLLIGTTRDEMQMFAVAGGTVDDPTLTDWFRATFGARCAEALGLFRRQFPKASNGELVGALRTHAELLAPARLIAESRSACGAPTWMYRFDWASTAFDGVLGSCHALDVPFVFDNLDADGAAAFTGNGTDRQAVADAFVGVLGRFIRDGDPGWERYDCASRAVMHIDSVMALRHDPDPELRTLWAGT